MLDTAANTPAANIGLGCLPAAASVGDTVLYCIVLYCTLLYSTVLYCTVLHCTVLQVGDTYVTDQCLVIGWGKAGGAQWCQQQSLHFIHFPHNRTDRYGRRGRAHAWLFDIGRQHQVQN